MKFLINLCIGIVCCQISCCAETNKAETFIQDLGNKALNIINEKNTTNENVKNKFNSLLDKHFAVEKIARFSLGKYYRSLPADKKEKFNKSFRNMLSNTYSSRFSEYKTSKFRVISSRVKSKKDKFEHVLVTAKLIVPNKQDIDIVWSVYNMNGNFKIYDAIISDVSVSKIQQNEFMGRISKIGFAKFLDEFINKY